jgi:hypothetical protein
MFKPERTIGRLKAEFEEAKARIWQDATMPLEEKGPAVERAWREFDRERRELRNAAQVEEATENEAASPRRMMLPRRRRRQWK